MQGYNSNGVSGYLVKTIEAYCDGQPNCMDEVIETLIKDRTREVVSGIAILSQLHQFYGLHNAPEQRQTLSTQFMQLKKCAKCNLKL